MIGAVAGIVLHLLAPSQEKDEGLLFTIAFGICSAIIAVALCHRLFATGLLGGIIVALVSVIGMFAIWVESRR